MLNWSGLRVFNLSLEEILSGVQAVINDPRAVMLLNMIFRHPLAIVAMFPYLTSVSLLSICFVLHTYSQGFDIHALLYSLPAYFVMVVALTAQYFFCVDFATRRLAKLFWSEPSEKVVEEIKAGPILLRLRILDDGEASGLYVCVQRKIVQETFLYGAMTKEEGLALGADDLSQGSKGTYLFEQEESKGGICLKSRETNTHMTVLRGFPQTWTSWLMSLPGCNKRDPVTKGTICVISPERWNGPMYTTSRETFELRPSDEDGEVLFNAYYNVYVRVVKSGHVTQILGVTRPSLASRFNVERQFVRQSTTTLRDDS